MNTYRFDDVSDPIEEGFESFSEWSRWQSTFHIPNSARAKEQESKDNKKRLRRCSVSSGSNDCHKTPFDLETLFEGNNEDEDIMISGMNTNHTNINNINNGRNGARNRSNSIDLGLSQVQQQEEQKRQKQEAAKLNALHGFSSKFMSSSMHANSNDNSNNGRNSSKCGVNGRTIGNYKSKAHASSQQFGMKISVKKPFVMQKQQQQGPQQQQQQPQQMELKRTSSAAVSFESKESKYNMVCFIFSVVLFVLLIFCDLQSHFCFVFFECLFFGFLQLWTE